ncbi:MAG TPA: tryptophan--tRNA ligase [Candidatus Dormibacteraeota bacterium]|nr:tryptophan--tRNA ligase [Candidatus Dormibacteraeota bacterium]
MTKPVILTGLRANNDLHLGNYFGALLPIIEMSKRKAGKYQINLFVPDLHSFTTPVDHHLLYAQTLNNIKLFVAAGLDLGDPDLYLYRQSFIPAHSELTWILDCFTGVGEMSRTTHFNDKSTTLGKERATIGLLNYPVLMAADILLYNATYVPVGDDQSQHLEFTRDLAIRMNGRFGELFTVPKPVNEQHKFFGNDSGLRIKDLVNPTTKMSKSDSQPRGVIFLGDSPDQAARKIMGATTDSLNCIKLDFEKQPAISNLLQILSLLQGKDLKEVASFWEGKTSYGQLKTVVSTAVTQFLTDFQSSVKAIDEHELLKKLKMSELSMNHQANDVLEKVQQAVGLRSNG